MNSIDKNTNNILRQRSWDAYAHLVVERDSYMLSLMKEADS